MKIPLWLREASMSISKRSFLKLSGAALTAPTLPAHAQNPVGKLRIMQGPMIGAVTPQSALIWVRLSGAHSVEIEYGTSPLLFDAERSSVATAKPEDDYTVRIQVNGLEPDTHYYYRVYVDGSADDYLENLPPIPFKTAPRSGRHGTVRIGFGSCCRFQKDPVQDIWTAVAQAAPDLFLWLNDNYGVFLDLQNINNEPLGENQGRSEWLTRSELYGMTGYIGANVRF